MSELLARTDVRALLAAFAEAGASARVVGGAVRDAVMGRPPGDIDIATPMLPADVMALAQRKGWKAVPTGIEHGTVTLVIDSCPYEVTTLRRDVETNGRRAVVAFTDDWREDAFRRDFTLNALSLSADGTIHDHATGITDARAGIIRFMGDPEERIREDYLRILRFFRFQANHGVGAPEAAGLAACAKLKEGMAGISRERVRQELLKLLVAPGAPRAVEAMDGIGLWPFILPDVGVVTAALTQWTALDATLPGSSDPISALATLVADDAPSSAISGSLRLSRAEAARLELFRAQEPLLRHALQNHAVMAEAVYRVGSAAFAPAVRTASARTGCQAETVAAAMAAAAPFLAHPPRNPFSSQDAADLGVAAGPRMGIVLKAAEAAWITAGLPREAATVRRILEAAAASN